MMSADAPTPSAEPPTGRSQVAKNNRRQVLLYAFLTLILTIATVWGGRVALKNSETLTFAVGAPNGEEATMAVRFVSKDRGGDRVIIAKGSGHYFEGKDFGFDDGEFYRLIKDKDVAAIVRAPAAEAVKKVKAA